MSKLQKSHYKDGQYFDTTTGTFYIPKDRCEICKAKFPLSVHHKLEQGRCMRDLKAVKTRKPSTWTQEFINDNQELFTLCQTCHDRIHSKSWTEDRFYKEYRLRKQDYTFG